jgi:putative ABC transport system permease protein
MMRAKRQSAPGIWGMALRNIGRRPRRSALSAVAIGLAAFTMVMLLSFLAGIKADMRQSIRRYYTGDVLIQQKDYDRSTSNTLGLFIPAVSELRAELKKQPGIVSASPRISGGASVFTDGDTVFFPFLGMDFTTDPMKLSQTLVSGKLPRPGEREALISTGLAQRLKLGTGDELTAVTQTLRGSSNGMTFRVTGVVKPDLGAFSGPYLFTGFATAGRLVHLEDGATSLLVSGGKTAEELAQKAGEILASRGLSDIKASPWDRSSATYSLIQMAGVSYNFIGIFFICLASTVIINTMLMVVLERSREIGTLAAMGMERRTLRRLFLAESAVLSGLGSAGGTLIGCLLTLALAPAGLDYSAAMQGMNLEMRSIIMPVLEIQTPLVVFAAATSVATLFTILPIRRINRMNIVEVLRGEA